MSFEKRRNNARLRIRAAAIVFAAVVTPFVATPSADAASTPSAACGSSFHEIDHHNLPFATIYLFYDGTENCVVTWKTAYVGTPSQVEAGLWLAGQTSTKVTDARTDYKYYAGPVKLAAKGKCIQWDGEAQKPGSEWSYIDNYWKSKSSHCG